MWICVDAFHMRICVQLSFLLKVNGFIYENGAEPNQNLMSLDQLR